MSESGREPSGEPLPPSEETEEPAAHSNEQAWTAVIIGLVLLVAIYSLNGKTAIPPDPAGERRSSSPVPMITPEAVPLVTGEEALPELFARAGCPVCHTIPGVQGATGLVGPALLLGTSGPLRLADPLYTGKATTVREYIVESVLSPGVYVVPGYPDGTMPTWYGQKLSATALEKMAAYLETLAGEAERQGSQ